MSQRKLSEAERAVLGEAVGFVCKSGSIFAEEDGGHTICAWFDFSDGTKTMQMFRSFLPDPASAMVEAADAIRPAVCSFAVGKTQ